MRIDHDGVDLDVRLEGSEDGAPVVLLHGLSSCAETYDFLRSELPEYRLIRLDFRGHGRSDRAPGAYRLDDYAADVVTVLEDVVGGPAVLVGHSLGAITAARVATTRPELTTAMFLEDPPLFLGDKAVFEASPFAVVFPLIRSAIERWQAAGASAAEIATQLMDSPSLSGRATMGEENWPDAIAAFGVGFAALDPTVYDPVFDGTAFDKHDPATEIPAPGVILQPDRELGAAFFDEHAAAVAAVNPQLEIVRCRGVGHLVHDSRTHRSVYLEQLRRFLRSHCG